MPRIRCQVCRACEENPRVQEIVHKVKFEKILPLQKVIDLVTQEAGITFNKIALSRHYNKHMDPALTLNYARQKAVIASLPGKKGGGLDVDASPGETLGNKSYIRYTPRAKYSFDMLAKLKVMFADMSTQYEAFQQETGGRITGENVETYAKIADSLRKMASDIARIEASKEVITEIIKYTLTNIFSSLVKEFISFVEAKFTEQEREDIAAKMKEAIVRCVKKVDQEFKRKLI